MDYYVTGSFIFIVMNIVKEGMNNIKYHMALGATATFKKRTMEESKGLGLMDVNGIPSIFIFEKYQRGRLKMLWILFLK